MRAGWRRTTRCGEKPGMPRRRTGNPAGADPSRAEPNHRCCTHHASFREELRGTQGVAKPVLPHFPSWRQHGWNHTRSCMTNMPAKKPASADRLSGHSWLQEPCRATSTRTSRQRWARGRLRCRTAKNRKTQSCRRFTPPQSGLRCGAAKITENRAGKAPVGQAPARPPSPASAKNGMRPPARRPTPRRTGRGAARAAARNMRRPASHTRRHAILYYGAACIRATCCAHTTLQPWPSWPYLAALAVPAAAAPNLRHPPDPGGDAGAPVLHVHRL